MKKFSLMLIALFFVISCGDTVKRLDPSGDTDAVMDDDVLVDSDEVARDDADKVIKDDSDEAIKNDSDEAIKDDSDEVAKDDSDEAVKDDSDEVVKDDSDEVAKDDSDEVATPDDDSSLSATGETCLAKESCKSGKCVDGYCCESKCEGLCEACNVADHFGECAPIPNGKDPGDECVAADKSSCGQNGFCDGKGACAVYNTSTVCSSTCDGSGDSLSVLYCDGDEHCVPPIKTVSCNNYACQADFCLDSCDNGGDDHSLCDDTHYCIGGSCDGVRKNKGEKCNDHDYECKSNNCDWEGAPMMGDYKCQ